MNKLIELLNQFEEEKKSDNHWGLTYDNELIGLSNIREARLSVISKEFGFIKWLVDNDKIDKFYYENSVRVKRYIDKYEEYDYVFPMDYEQLIMLLSIEDNPIKWLCEILK